jgi:hypothetical protein
LSSGLFGRRPYSPRRTGHGEYGLRPKNRCFHFFLGRCPRLR